MVECTKEITKMTKKLDMESSSGLMVENTMEVGKMVNNTEKAFT